jgi:hypothetical protein
MAEKREVIRSQKEAPSAPDEIQDRYPSGLKVKRMGFGIHKTE